MLIVGTVTLVTDVMTGRLTWNDTALACRVDDCGATNRWVLSIGPAAWGGERAWMTCSAGHQQEHPLIYPELVHRVIGFTRAPGEHWSAIGQKLADWDPHWVDGRVYRDWKQPGPINWAEAWPELVKREKQLEQIFEWAKNSRFSDEAGIWYLTWGTADPDHKHVELLDADGEPVTYSTAETAVPALR